MLKITIIVSLMFIVSVLCIKSHSCESCGSECAPACGTRRFRSCCFNYLRKKRQDPVLDLKTENIKQPKHQIFVLDDSPEAWSNVVSNDFKVYPQDDVVMAFY